MATFLIYIKRCLRFRTFLAVLIFIPVMAVVFAVFGKNIVGDVKFGVYAEGELGKYISEELQKEKGFKFIAYDSVEKLSYDVAVCEIDSGYVFDENFDKAVENYDFRESIKVMCSESSGGYNFANEVVFSKIMYMASPLIADDFLKTIGIDKGIDKYYDNILENINVFSFNFIEVGEEKIKDNSFGFENIFACFVFIGSVFGAIVRIEDKRKNINIGGFYNVLAFSALLSFSSFISCVILGEASLLVLLKYFMFAFLSASFSYLFTFVKNVFLIYGFMPVLTVFTFSLSAAELWTGMLKPVFDVLKWIFPIGLYCEENIAGMVFYLGVIFLLYVINFLNNRKNIIRVF